MGQNLEPHSIPVLTRSHMCAGCRQSETDVCVLKFLTGVLDGVALILSFPAIVLFPDLALLLVSAFPAVPHPSFPSFVQKNCYLAVFLLSTRLFSDFRTFLVPFASLFSLAQLPGVDCSA